MIAIGYARISKKGDEKSVSIELQRQQIAEYCKRLGFDLKHFVSHDGVSGTKRHRFASLDKALKEFGASCVVYYVQDRIARDVALGDWFKTLAKRGIEVHEAAGAGKLDIKTANGRMVVNIKSAVDAAYAEVIGEKSAKALAHLRDHARRYTNIPPLGYSYVDGAMVEEPEEQRGLVILRECVKVGLGARRALAVLHARRYTGRQSLKCVWNALERIKNDQKILHPLWTDNEMVQINVP